MNDPISGATKTLTHRLPNVVAKGLAPWASVPGGPTVMRGLVMLAPVPIPAKLALKGYVEGMSTHEAANTARGVTQAA